MDKQRYDIMIGMQAGELAAGVKSVKGNLKDLKTEFKNTLDVLNTVPERFGQKLTPQLETARKKAAQLVAEVEKLQKLGNINIKTATPKQRAALMAGVSETQSAIRAAQPSIIAADIAKADLRAERELQNRSITLRYALYDVAAATQQASQALMGYASASLMAAAAQERAFSQIQKTLIGDVTTEELDNLKKELIALSTTIPVSFTELTRIGMLGSQLGIAAGDIAKFTSVVAKFTAITGMSVDEAAMGFGKLQNLLGLNGDQFEALGSAIAKVGVESAATEQQIINTAGQFAAVAKAAGFSASEIIGLSASFASLKIAPEETRGVIVRTFSEISTAVSSFSKVTETGNERLKRFAQISGLTAKEFADGWSDKSGGASYVFERFVRGLSESDIPKELRAIGLDGIRTSKGLTALAGDVDAVFGSQANIDASGSLIDNLQKVNEEIEGTIEIARKAGLEGTFLDESFGAIVEDLASKLDMLKQSFENVLASAVGDEAFLGAIGAVIDIITRFNDILTIASQNSDVFRGFVQATVIVAALGAAILSLLAVFALAGAGAAAMRTAYFSLSSVLSSLGISAASLKGQLMGLAIGTKATSTSFVGMGAGAGVAATGVRGLIASIGALKLAIASTGVGLAFVLIGELASAFMQAAEASEDGVTGIDEITDAEERLIKETNAAKDELMSFIKQGLEPLASSVSAQESLFNLGKALRENGQDWSEYSQNGRENINALQSTIESYVTAFGGDAQLLANNLLALREYMIQMGMGGAAAFDMLDLAIAETGVVAQKAVFNFASLDDAFNGVSTGAGKAKTALELMTEALEKALKMLDATASIEDTLDGFGASISKNGTRIDLFTESGRDNFKALRDVIFGLNKMVDGDPQSLANALASLREAMIRLGITSVTAFQTVDLAIQATGRTGVATAEVINGLVSTISQAAQEAKGLRTITDYVSDLSSVLSDALENRYGRQDARDSITSAWNSIAEAASDAKKSVEEANASLNATRATKAMLEYQLSVALRYGDTLRAAAITAALGDVNSQIVSAQEEAAEAADNASMTLVGNSNAAIENRQDVRELAGSYNEYLASLAATGMSSRQLAEQAAILEQEFLNQGVALGFSREELAEYTQAFKQDFTTVINNLPRDITLNVNTDPALQAIIDFVKDANEELARLLSGTPGGGSPTFTGGTATTGGGTTTTGGGTTTTARQNLESQINQLRNDITKIDSDLAPLRERVAYLNTRVKTPAVRQELAEKNATINDLTQTKVRIANRIDSLNAQLAQLPAFARGGLVRGAGSGTSDSINARLSNGEYVLRANAVKYYGTDFMNSLNQMQVQAGSSGGQGGGVIYLSPEDRALLRSAIDRPISLYTENTKIASSANAGNVVLAQRGAR